MQDAATLLDIGRERTSVTGTDHWKAVCVEMAHARFGEGRLEKCRRKSVTR